MIARCVLEVLFWTLVWVWDESGVRFCLLLSLIILEYLKDLEKICRREHCNWFIPGNRCIELVTKWRFREESVLLLQQAKWGISSHHDSRFHVRNNIFNDRFFPSSIWNSALHVLLIFLTNHSGWERSIGRYSRVLSLCSILFISRNFAILFFFSDGNIKEIRTCWWKSKCAYT